MEAYRELAEAVLAASAVCTLWHCPADGQDYSLQDLSFVSQLVDIEEELPGKAAILSSLTARSVFWISRTGRSSASTSL